MLQQWNSINIQNGKFDYIVSLGSFCSPALELERFGFRDGSYPFDWVLSHDFSKVLELISNQFEGFLDVEALFQKVDARQMYYNKEKDITFVHDFSKYLPLKEQMDAVTDKYNRRIERFYQSIKKPTLFIRYVGGDNELNFILEKEQEILYQLKEYNEDNEIVYIVNSDVWTSINNIRKLERSLIAIVEKDSGDTVARKFFNQCEELVALMKDHYDESKRSKNLEYYQSKQKKKQKMRIAKAIRKATSILKKPYIYDKTVNNM